MFYKEYIKKDQDNQLLCFPHCHYDAILGKIKIWDDLLLHGVDGTGLGKKRKRNESAQGLEGRINAVVAKSMKKFNHKDIPNKKPAEKAGKSSGKSAGKS